MAGGVEFDGPPEELWRSILLGTDPRYRRARSIFKRLPAEPRCKMCAAPFGKPGAGLMRLLGREPWSMNPKYCSFCFGVLTAQHGGAEIECSLLFADVRGSTALAEGMRPAEFRRLMGRFYETASPLLVEHDAIVDKFIGDEVFAIFIPALAGERHAERAIEAARRLLVATGHEEEGGPWLPVGAGVHAGNAFVGAVGEDAHTELTALGDAVNVAARLASAAQAGEILVTTAAASLGGLDLTGLETRHLDLRGKTISTDVVVVRVAAPQPAESAR